MGKGERTKWRKVNKMEQYLLFPGSSSPTYPRAGKCSPPPGRCRSTEHAPGDVNPKRSKLTRPRLWRRPYQVLILPTALPLPVPMHKSPLPAGAGVTSSVRIRGLENITREHRRDFPGPPTPEDQGTSPESVCIFAVKGCRFLMYFGVMFNYLALLN